MDSSCAGQYIPQRDPIKMVDRLVSVADSRIETGYVVKPGDYFVGADNLLVEAGLVEHIAQSASALAGYKAVASGADTAPVGYIGEVKGFRFYKNPSVGDELLTEVTFGAEVEGITIVSGVTRVAGEVVAEGQLKIYVEKA